MGQYKRISLTLILMLAFMSARAQVQELYLQGIALSDRGNLNEALRCFEQVLDRSPDRGDCLLRIGELYYRMGMDQAAMNYLQKLETVSPGRGSYLMARILAREGNAGDAVHRLETHLRSPYKLPRPRILLDEAFTGIEQSPEWKKLWQGEWYSEEEEFLQEIRYLSGSGENLQALELLDARIQEKPGGKDLYIARGDVLLKMNQFQGAAMAYSKALAQGPPQYACYHGRGRAFLGQGKLEKAVADLERAYRMEPENLDLLLEIGRVYREDGQSGRAGGYLGRYLDYYPDDAEAHLECGQMYFDSGKYLDALDQFNACLKVDTGDPRFFLARGKTYLETGTYRYALNDLGMALDLDPGLPEAWYLKGLARWNLGNPEGAAGDWQRAARLGSFEAAEKLEEINKK